MADEPTINIAKTPKSNGESKVLNVTIRGWIAVILIGTVCLSHLCVIFPSIFLAIKSKDLTLLSNIGTISEPLYSMSVAALGFYFGTHNSNKQQTTKD